MVHLNSDVLATLPLLHLHTDKNARDATFIRVTVTPPWWPVAIFSIGYFNITINSMHPIHRLSL